MTKDQEKVIGITIHSAVTGFLLLAAMSVATKPTAEIDSGTVVLATYVASTFASSLYPDQTTRTRIMIASVALAGGLSFLAIA